MIYDLHVMLQELNINTEMVIGEGLNHVYPLYPIPEANDAFDRTCDIVSK